MLCLLCPMRFTSNYYFKWHVSTIMCILMVRRWKVVIWALENNTRVVSVLSVQIWSSEGWLKSFTADWYRHVCVREKRNVHNSAFCEYCYLIILDFTMLTGPMGKKSQVNSTCLTFFLDSIPSGKCPIQ